MQKEFDFNPNSAVSIAFFTRDLVEYYICNTDEREFVVEQLKRVYSKEHSEIFRKVTTSNKFRATLKEKVRKNRVSEFKELLLEVDKEKYSKFNFDW